MKTLVIGAHGKIGRIFCERARANDLELRAMVRSEQQRDALAGPGVEPVVADLEAEFAHTFEGCDRIVFTAGSGGHTGGDKTLLVDLYGAIRAIEASEVHGIEHFVMVSALRVDRPLEAPLAMRHYFVAKKLADERLLESPVPSTILRPGRLTDAPGSGRVTCEIGSAEGLDVSRDNVADCIAASLMERTAQGRVIDLLDGDTPIERLFADSV